MYVVARLKGVVPEQDDRRIGGSRLIHLSILVYGCYSIAEPIHSDRLHSVAAGAFTTDALFRTRSMQQNAFRDTATGAAVKHGPVGARVQQRATPAPSPLDRDQLFLDLTPYSHHILQYYGRFRLSVQHCPTRFKAPGTRYSSSLVRYPLPDTCPEIFFGRVVGSMTGRARPGPT